MASSRSSGRSGAAKPADLLGVETPRIWTPPLRALTPETSAGFECIQFAETVLGIILFPWQRWLLIHALELLPASSSSPPEAPTPRSESLAGAVSEAVEAMTWLRPSDGA